MIAERKVGSLSSGISIIASWFDGPLLFAFITLGFLGFYGVIWICAGAMLGLTIYIFAAPKIRRIADKQ